MLTTAIFDEHERATDGAKGARLKSSKILRHMRRLKKSRRESAPSLLEEEGLQANCKISYIDVGLKEKHPVLRVSDMFCMLGNDNSLNSLSGGHDLFKSCATFWERYAESAEGKAHPVYTKHAGRLHQVVPMAVYADEGQTHKKAQFLVLASQPIIGQGTLSSSKRDESELGTNMAGSSFVTRLVYSVMHVKLYRKQSKVFDNLIASFALELQSAFEHGIPTVYGGDEVMLYPAVLFCKGDWPMLKKLGNLTRTHHQSLAKKANASGLCHLCMAGSTDFPDWHKCVDATWMCPESLDTPDLPWRVESSLTSLATSDNIWCKTWFYRPDIFHTLHKGLMAELTGSALVARPCFK